MATPAQIEANRRNAQKSTGPKTAAGKARSRLNALKHGLRASQVCPVLPHEDPREAELQVLEWIESLQPHGGVELALVTRAARLAWMLRRGERHEAAYLAHRVRVAQQRAESRRIRQVQILGRKLFALAGPQSSPEPQAGWDDLPAVLVHQLEASTEGCRWLLQRWGELRHLLERDVPWTSYDRFRLVRLLGKQPLAAIDDPDLNRLLLAGDELQPNSAAEFWTSCQKLAPRQDPAFSGLARWREITERPSGPQAARAILEGVICEAMERLRGILEQREADELVAAQTVADRAAFDPGASFERLRRCQTARAREFLRILDLILKLQAARRTAGTIDPASDDRRNPRPSQQEGTSQPATGAKQAPNQTNTHTSIDETLTSPPEPSLADQPPPPPAAAADLAPARTWAESVALSSVQPLPESSSGIRIRPASPRGEAFFRNFSEGTNEPVPPAPQPQPQRTVQRAPWVGGEGDRSERPRRLAGPERPHSPSWPAAPAEPRPKEPPLRGLIRRSTSESGTWRP